MGEGCGEGRRPRSAVPSLDPARGIEGAFQRAAARMRELPICNPALRIEAVGLRAWQGEWLCAVVSPWTLSLVLLPGEGGRVRRLGADERQRWSFPLGDYDFFGAEDPELGPYQTCSILSPPWELASHEDARAAARAAVEALLSDPAGPPLSPPGGERGGVRGREQATPALSRRTFLAFGRGTR